MISQTEVPEQFFQPLLNAYKQYNIPVYGERKNSGRGISQSMGVLYRRNYGIGESRNNDSYPLILREARELAKIICPQIPYTTIAVNINYEALTHIDKNNIGPSCVVAFGDYTGGELVVENLPHNIRHRPFIFNASCTPHSVSPILSGTRYSIVFFRQRFPKWFNEKYGDSLMYDDILSLIPPRLAGQKVSEVRVPKPEKFYPHREILPASDHSTSNALLCD
jgi:hypothetical protein